MLQELRLFFTAVQFFTRIPLPAWVGHSAQQLDQATRYLPAVGMCVGVLAAVVLWVCAQVLPLSLAVALSMVSGILATGAFHEDGLSDFADGMGGGYTREKILAIMKDSRIGAYGAIAIVLTLLIKYQALLALGTHSLAYAAAALVAAHGVSRLMAVSLMVTQRYVRDDDSARAKPAAGKLSHTSFAIALVFGIAALGIMLAARASVASVLAALGTALLMRIYLAWLLQKKLGGHTGDCLGAVQQLTEIAFYLGLFIVF